MCPLLKVPNSFWSRTPLHLMATAGIRQQSRNVSEAIMKSCREVLSASGFLFKPTQARVLTGSMEGLFAWTAVNYATGKLQVRSAPWRTMWPSAARPNCSLFLPQNLAKTGHRLDVIHESVSRHRPWPPPMDDGVLTLGVFELGGASMQVVDL